MSGANTPTAKMNDLQLRLREARKVCADDGFNNQFCQVFNDAIDHISAVEKQRDELDAKLLRALDAESNAWARVAELEDLRDSLFEKIKHGDDDHQAWLKNAIEDHFARAREAV